MNSLKQYSAEEISRALPEPEQGHVSEEDLWCLVHPDFGPLSEELRNQLKHALDCRTCYLGLVQCREALTKSLDDEGIDLPALADAAWQKYRVLQLKVFLSFVAAVGAAQSNAKKLRIRLASVGWRMRMLSGAIPGPPVPIEREIGEPWELERTFGDF